MPPTLEHDHTPEAIARRLADGPRINYLRDWVYGGIDGAVTTFAIVAGAAGADLAARTVLILGAANLLADGFSMAAGNYAATRTEIDDARRLRRMEERHIRLAPEGEREEVRQLLAAKGFAGADLARAVTVMTSDRERWVEMMLIEEHGLAPQTRDPVTSAIATFSAFALCGSLPLAPYLLGGTASLELAVALAAATFFAIGSLKSRWSPAHWWASGCETLTIGLSAAAIAYLVGDGLSRWLGGA